MRSASEKTEGHKTLILNSSAVIELVENNLLRSLALLRRKANYNFIIPTPVWNELSQETRNALLNYIDDTIKIEEVDPAKIRELSAAHPPLGRGELSVILLALEKDATAILDDNKARQAAKRIGLKLHGTLWLIIERSCSCFEWLALFVSLLGLVDEG